MYFIVYIMVYKVYIYIVCSREKSTFPNNNMGLSLLYKMLGQSQPHSWFVYYLLVYFILATSLLIVWYFCTLCPLIIQSHTIDSAVYTVSIGLCLLVRAVAAATQGR